MRRKKRGRPTKAVDDRKVYHLSVPLTMADRDRLQRATKRMADFGRRAVLAALDAAERAV